MTGRDLIIYILENGLEDELVFDDKRVGRELLGFMTAMDAAREFGVGLATIRVWYDLGFIKGFKIGDAYFISANIKNPIEGGSDVTKDNTNDTSMCNTCNRDTGL